MEMRAALAALAHGLKRSLLKAATARMLPILVVHGQIDDERHLTCHFGMLSASAISNGRWAVATATPPTLRITSWRRRSARFLAPELRYRLGPAHAQRASDSQLAVSREAAGAGQRDLGGWCVGRLHVDASAPRA